MRCTSLMLLSIAMAGALVSCRKDDEDVIPPDPNAAYSISDFGLMDQDNYWVCERRQYDSNWVQTAGPWLDSVFIDGDTVFNGDTYMVQRRVTIGGSPSGLVQYLRVSGDRIVDPYGNVIFQYGVFDQVVWTDTIGVISVDYSLSSSVLQQSVPAGPFTCYNWQGWVETISGGGPPVPPERQPYYLWCPGVGEVKRVEPFIPAGHHMLVRELVRYHVE